jgi:GntR family transcriptional regulator, transcriptional repressor for pyruvate dehydrogenase complex
LAAELGCAWHALGRNSVALTDDAISKIRALIQSGSLLPGSRLPSEPQLASDLRMSRSSLREAVKALETAHVLEVRRGDGTFVTSLAPNVLLQGLGFAIDLLQDSVLFEVMEVRRMLEPTATGTAAARINSQGLAALRRILDQMLEDVDDSEALAVHDVNFHRTVIEANGNETLSSVVEGISGHAVRPRVWRGILDREAITQTQREHEAIYEALLSGDPSLASAAALLHINGSENRLRGVLHPPEA